MSPLNDNDFIVVTSLVSGDLLVDKNYQYNNASAKTVTVVSGVRARIYGNIETLILEKDSKIFVHGTIGKVINNGGRYFQFLAE